MRIIGNRVILRPLDINDLAKLAVWNGDSEVQSFVDCDLPTALPELERWYQVNVPDRHYQIFGIEKLEGGLIGDLELDHICWSKREAELRIRIGEKDCWNQGYGSEAVRIITNHLMTEKQFNRVYLRVYHFNQRAISCYLKNGFKAVGLLKRREANWKDIILMELTRAGFKKRSNRLAS